MREKLNYIEAFKSAMTCQLTKSSSEVLKRLSIFGLKVEVPYPFNSQNSSLNLTRSTKMHQPSLIPQMECLTTIMIANQTTDNQPTMFESILHREEKPFFMRELAHTSLDNALNKVQK
jgi:hypothetical protein